MYSFIHWKVAQTIKQNNNKKKKTLIPWQAGKPLTWDVTVVSTLADSYVHLSSQSAGGAAEAAATEKRTSTLTFQPPTFFSL